MRPFFRPAGVPRWADGPFLVDLDDPGDEERHILCCDPQTALCGIRICPEEIVDGLDEDEDDADVLCETCRWRELQRLPCGVRFCWLRRRLRRWWGSP